MIVGELLKRVRRRLDDAIGKPTDQFWKSDEIVDENLNDVLDDMCRISRKLIKDFQTVGEVLATGTVTITGVAGQLDTLKVNAVNILTGPVAFLNDSTDTATAVKNAINAFTYPTTYLGVQYTATSTLGVVTISAQTASGSAPNGYVVAATTSGGLSAATTDMTGGTSLCKMYLFPGQSIYQKHKKILEVPFIDVNDITAPLTRTSDAELNQGSIGWKTAEGSPCSFIEDDETIRFISVPDKQYTANLTVYRLRRLTYSASNLSQEIEIHEKYHKDIIPGILAQCFGKNDEETLRPGLAKEYEAKFEKRCREIAAELTLKTGGATTQGCNQEAFL